MMVTIPLPKGMLFTLHSRSIVPLKLHSARPAQRYMAAPCDSKARAHGRYAMGGNYYCHCGARS